MNDLNRPAPCAFSRSDLLAFASAEPGFAKSVDADMRGKSITDYDVLLWGAYGPAVERIVNLALQHHADKAPAPIGRAELLALAPEAIAQQTDYNFAKVPQPMSNYRMILDEVEHNYHTHLLALVNLALRKSVAGTGPATATLA